MRLFIQLRLQLLLLAILLFNNEYARANSCLDFFSSIQIINQKTTTYAEIGPTVIAAQKVKGEFGGDRIHLLKIGMSWFSDYAKDGVNSQGDPRWIIQVFRNLAPLLGFNQTSPNLLETPDSVELNMALQRLNHELHLSGKDSILTRFYNSIHSDKESTDDYLEKFENQWGLPLSSVDSKNSEQSSTYYVHDISYHTFSFLMPNELLIKLNARIKALRILEILAKEKFANSKNINSKLSKIIQEMKEKLVSEIDVTSAQFKDISYKIIVEQTSPTLQFLLVSGSVPFHSSSELSEFVFDEFKNKIEIHTKKLNSNDEILIEELMEEYQSQVSQELRDYERTLQTRIHDQLMKQRMLEIIEALQRIQSSNRRTLQ